MVSPKISVQSALQGGSSKKPLIAEHTQQIVTDGSLRTTSSDKDRKAEYKNYLASLSPEEKATQERLNKIRNVAGKGTKVMDTNLGRKIVKILTPEQLIKRKIQEIIDDPITISDRLANFQASDLGDLLSGDLEPLIAKWESATVQPPKWYEDVRRAALREYEYEQGIKQRPKYTNLFIQNENGDVVPIGDSANKKHDIGKLITKDKKSQFIFLQSGKPVVEDQEQKDDLDYLPQEFKTHDDNVSFADSHYSGLGDENSERLSQSDDTALQKEPLIQYQDPRSDVEIANLIVRDFARLKKMREREITTTTRNQEISYEALSFDERAQNSHQYVFLMSNLQGNLIALQKKNHDKFIEHYKEYYQYLQDDQQLFSRYDFSHQIPSELTKDIDPEIVEQKPLQNDDTLSINSADSGLGDELDSHSLNADTEQRITADFSDESTAQYTEDVGKIIEPEMARSLQKVEKSEEKILAVERSEASQSESNPLEIFPQELEEVKVDSAMIAKCQEKLKKLHAEKNYTQIREFFNITKEFLKPLDNDLQLTQYHKYISDNPNLHHLYRAWRSNNELDSEYGNRNYHAAYQKSSNLKPLAKLDRDLQMEEYFAELERAGKSTVYGKFYAIISKIPFLRFIATLLPDPFYRDRDEEKLRAIAKIRHRFSKWGKEKTTIKVRYDAREDSAQILSKKKTPEYQHYQQRYQQFLNDNASIQHLLCFQHDRLSELQDELTNEAIDAYNKVIGNSFSGGIKELWRKLFGRKNLEEKRKIGNAAVENESTASGAAISYSDEDGKETHVAKSDTASSSVLETLQESIDKTLAKQEAIQAYNVESEEERALPTSTLINKATSQANLRKAKPSLGFKKLN